MAENIEDNLVYLIEIDRIHKNYLGLIRHWKDLKFATEAKSIWIKNFTELQLESTEFKSIPFIKLYVSRGNLLYSRLGLVPIKKLPNLLWTPIERALPIQLTKLNPNYFGLNQTLVIQLIQSDIEQEATGHFVHINEANSYITQTSSIRLKRLKWILVNQQYALILGAPLLPIPGKAYWLNGNHIIPLGYQLEYPILEKYITEQMTGGNSNKLIWWNEEFEYCLVEKESFKPLSISSWRQTVDIR